MRRKDDEKEQRIRSAVIEVILEEGFSGASISKIARRAEVSPATVYIYYDNKEDMMKSIFEQYSAHMWASVLTGVDRCGTGACIVETLVRNYYRYMTDNEMMFSFVEQFSNCPALARECSDREPVSRILSLFHDLKEKKILKPYSDVSLFAVLFTPVKELKAGSMACHCAGDSDRFLSELIGMIQETILL